MSFLSYLLGWFGTLFGETAEGRAEIDPDG
jgi:hypothetical protein